LLGTYFQLVVVMFYNTASFYNMLTRIEQPNFPSMLKMAITAKFYLG